MKTMVQKMPDYAAAVQDRAAGILEAQVALGYPVRLDAWELYRRQYGTMLGDDEFLAATINSFETPYPMARLGTLAAAAATSAPGSVLRRQAAEGVRAIEQRFAASFFDNTGDKDLAVPVYTSAGCRPRAYGNLELVSDFVKLARYAGDPALAMDYVERYKLVLGPQYPQMAGHIARDYIQRAQSNSDFGPVRDILHSLSSDFNCLKGLASSVDPASLGTRPKLDLGAMLVNLEGSRRRVAGEIRTALQSMYPDHPRFQLASRATVSEAAYGPEPVISAETERYVATLEQVRMCAVRNNKEAGQKVIAESGLDEGSLVSELAVGLVERGDYSPEEWLGRVQRNLPDVISLLSGRITEKNALKRIQGFRAVMARMLDAGYPDGVVLAYDLGMRNLSHTDGLPDRLHYATQSLVVEAHRQKGNYHKGLDMAGGRHLQSPTAAAVLGICIQAARRHRLPAMS